MSAPFKKSLSQKEHGFTLIELIIVVVIIGILALVAIPRYFANVGKAQKSQVYANLDAIRRAQLAYYATYGVYASDFPVVAAIDGDTIVNMTNCSSTAWKYDVDTGACPTGGGRVTAAYKLPGSTCFYALCTDGYTYQSCTP
ncbi:MAG: prepilin-type N-terminal cleavage/methylation domain-containing protein [Candidatus Omnitrophota bacterium]